MSLLRADLWEKIQSSGALLEPWTIPIPVWWEQTEPPIMFWEVLLLTLTVAETVFPARVVIGVDFLAENGCTVQVGKKILDFPNHGVSSPLIHSNSKYVLPPTGVFLVETVRIPAFCEMEVMATTQTFLSECNWILKGEQRDKVPVVAARAVVSPVNRTLPVRLLNPAMESVVVYKGTQIACLKALDESDVIDSASVAVVHKSESFSHIDHLTKKQQPMWDLVEKNDHLD